MRPAKEARYDIFGLTQVSRDEVKQILIKKFDEMFPDCGDYSHIDSFLRTTFDSGVIPFKLTKLSCPTIDSIIPYIFNGSIRYSVGLRLKNKYDVRSAFSLSYSIPDKKDMLPINFNELLLKADNGDEKALDDIYNIFKDVFDNENKKIRDFKEYMDKRDKELEKDCTQMSTYSENNNNKNEEAMNDYMINQLVIELRNTVEESLKDDELDNKESLNKLLENLNNYMDENNLQEE